MRLIERLIYLQKLLNMNDSEFYRFCELMNYKGVITTTDIVESGIRDGSVRKVNFDVLED